MGSVRWTTSSSGTPPRRLPKLSWFDRPLIDTQVPVAVAFSGSVRTSGSTSESPPGPGDYGALAIARTLGRIGVPVYLVAQESTTSPVFYSRYWEDKRGWNFFGGPEQESVSFLQEIGAELAQ